MHFNLSVPVLLVALTSSALAQTTEAPSATTTDAGPYDYCTSTTSADGPFFTGKGDVIPPIPCENGYYNVQAGFCCMGLNTTCENLKCQCNDSDKWWQLPLDDCIKDNPQWSGCPGNMLNGLCCSGPGIVLRGADMTPACTDGSAIFTVMTSNGTTSTSTLASSGPTTSLSTTSTTTSLSTSASPGGARRTGVPDEVFMAAMALVGAGGLAAAL